MEFQVNIFAVLVAAVLAFVVGWIWYGPLFGKSWQKLQGFTTEYLQQGGMVKIFGTSFILMLIMAFGMSMIFHNTDAESVTWMVGMLHGFFVGIAFVFTSIGVNYQYEHKPFKLLAINAGYMIFVLMIMGAVIGAWH